MPDSDTINDGGTSRLRSGVLFVGVAVILLGLTAAGLYLAKLRSHTLIKQNTSPVVVTPPVKVPSQTLPSDHPRQNIPKENPTPQTPQSSPPTAQSQPSPQPSRAPSLPSTGPDDLLWNAFGLGSLAFAIWRYIRSRALLSRRHSFTFDP